MRGVDQERTNQSCDRARRDHNRCRRRSSGVHCELEQEEERARAKEAYRARFRDSSVGCSRLARPFEGVALLSSETLLIEMSYTLCDRCRRYQEPGEEA